ncbi:MAG TPA: hypothetical protein VJK02_04310 [Anaerolineales bacterium]|nr:hypothetical protein [Anaerolineales bacterium]
MGRIIKWTVLVLFAVLVGSALAVAAFAAVRASSPSATGPGASIQMAPYGFGSSQASALNSIGPSSEPTPEPISDAPPSPYGYGRASMWAPWGGGRGYGAWGMMGPGMHGRSFDGPYPGFATAAAPLSIDQAVEATRQYLSAYGDPDLALAEVMEFSANFYADVKEESTDIHAFELLIDRYTGSVYPEIGPNMMWNAKYGHMGGWNPSVGTMTVTAQEALAVAQEWLEANLPGTTVDDAETFYGYYTVHVLTDGQVTGMLSVNGYTGQVWFHTWHGAFIGMQSLEEKPTD